MPVNSNKKTEVLNLVVCSDDLFLVRIIKNLGGVSLAECTLACRTGICGLNAPWVSSPYGKGITCEPHAPFGNYCLETPPPSEFPLNI